jgi:hypothetical protein
MGISKEQAVQEIRIAIHQVVGPAWADEMVIEADTSLGEGIELDSIEIAKVIELMFRKFPQVDFESWFKGMTLEAIVDMTVGDIAGFIAAEAA